MINANDTIVKISGNKEVIQKDLQHILKTLIVNTKIITKRDVKRILKYYCHNDKIKKIDRIKEKHYRKKRMKELDLLINELKRKGKKDGI